MKQFTAFIKKEFLEQVRSGRFMILGILFCLFGIMNPATAKMLPWLFEIMSEQLAENGMLITGHSFSKICLSYLSCLSLCLAVF